MEGTATCSTIAFRTPPTVAVAIVDCCGLLGFEDSSGRNSSQRALLPLLLRVKGLGRWKMGFSQSMAGWLVGWLACTPLVIMEVEQW